ncbi:cation:proton antiporter [Echinimonas agarilytica]|uniref:Sodium:proton antiporter n=1 Tax=Echinimonas agarilytica TaxID=1215918 RepID=A0AA41W6P7_9GAMM|nr:sodium:proton antiporter [Echinimonas agarilytica]MCM2679611.1 sodium:proton antiporter [Echinimonas agarilytica]
MDAYNTLCYLGAAALVIAHVNQRFGKLQNTIAITAFTVLSSIVIIGLGKLGAFGHSLAIVDWMSNINFQSLLLEGMLGFLLFAGGLGINLKHLSDQRREIAILVVCSTSLSTAIVGAGLWYVLQWLQFPLDFIYCLLFGALISPTDPIAVLAIVKKLNAPEQVAIQIEGESLFNDGFGLVLFVTLFGIAFGTAEPSIGSIGLLFLQEAIGGIVYGLGLGLLAHILIKATQDASLELLTTLTIPTAGFVFAEVIHVSGPLAMVVAGIFIANKSIHPYMSPRDREKFEGFWHLIDEFLNSLLFLLIGLVMITFTFHIEDGVIMLAAIGVVLAARFISIALPYMAMWPWRSYNPMSVPILTWGGLRGGLALAMAMSVPEGEMLFADKGIDVREAILVMTYAVVLFSILVQGSTIVPLIERAKRFNSGNSTQ